MAILDLNALRVIKPAQVFVPKRGNNKEEQKKRTHAVILMSIKNNDLTTTQGIVRDTDLATSTVYRAVAELKKSKAIIKTMGNGKGKYNNEFFSVA